MRIAYFDAASGVSGDMLLGSLLDAGAPLGAVREALGALGVGEEVALRLDERRAGAFRVAHLSVDLASTSRERHVPEILSAIDRSGLSSRVRERSRGTVDRLAQVESRLHGKPIEELHLHELSAADTLADIVGFWVAAEALAIDEIQASPINVGGGEVRFSHGRFGVPAPATAELLKGVPAYGSDDAGMELTTPTGAALIVTAARRFGAMPPMTIERIGYAVGSRESDPPLILRCSIGTA
ncbi:MAG TPA: LarC family nickel insertion protein [Candidatus Limnocylindria bacterium]|jgi:hypothetical protein|nr:LarC family nickel insertion protein [Candidatus Limnocylindria bacterium]